MVDIQTYKIIKSGKQFVLPNYVKEENSNRRLKQAIWAYFLLIIFEGALRKWFLPGLATPLLIVRDPIALWIVVTVWRRGLLPENIYLIGTFIIGVIGVFTAILFGHESFSVALFGARILLIHFPLMFAIGVILNRDDLIKIGKIGLIIAVLMVIITSLQFFSPQSSWVNRGIGGDMAGAGFSGAGGYLRPSGTFSFTNGLSAFYGFVATFIFFFWYESKYINKLLLLSATIALIAVIPLSISRGLLFQVGVTVLFSLIVVTRNPKFSGTFIIAGIGIVLALAVLSQTSFFQTATGAFTSRFEVANKAEGGMEGVLIDRYLGGMLGALSGNDDVPFFGYGLGMGTNVGAMLLTGKTMFLISEGEWGRLIGELGLLMGVGLIVIRMGFTMGLGLAAFTKIGQGDILPWLLMSYGLMIIPQGQWAQPTALGFSTLIGGLLLASLRAPVVKQ